ncbi:coth protein-domain-containing protein [Circinella umbellata]|nr:coth protein-domain-containing protein [Circinella umbellata]
MKNNCFYLLGQIIVTLLFCATTITSATSAAAINNDDKSNSSKNNTNPDIQYCVVAFPNQGEGVSVLINEQSYSLQPSTDRPYVFCGTAPYGQVYEYVYINSSGAIVKKEEQKRSLANNATTTGNEFFGRAPTVHTVPEVPQAFHPIYPPLFTNMNNSNEVATIIMTVDEQAFDAICQEPLQKHQHGGAQVFTLTYISNSETHSFRNVSIDNSGQSTKEYARQSFKIDFNKDVTNKNSPKQLLFGRSVIKLRGEQTDGSFIREKLVMDMLASAGAATLSSSWVRVFVNDRPLGLFLMTDDASTHLIDNVLHGGDWSYLNTGPTYKGNAIDQEHCANLEYLGDDPVLYSKDVYKLKDKGKSNIKLKKANKTTPLIEFIKQLSNINPAEATNAQNRGDLEKLIDPQNLMLHMAINYLIGSWDGFWFQASNFYLNQDLASKQWALVSYDFDETLGNGIETAGFVNVKYDAYTPSSAKRPLIDTILKSPYYRNEFETILKTLVKKFFKPSIIRPRLEAWIAMLRQDVEWDRSLPDHSPGKKVPWTIEDLEVSTLGITTTTTTTTSQQVTKKAEGYTGNSALSLSIADWVQQRSELICKQFGISDEDDIAAIGPYTDGRIMDGSGHVSDRTSSKTKQDANNNVPVAGKDTADATTTAPHTTSFTSIFSLFISIIAMTLIS